jgi:hypothetical protein
MATVTNIYIDQGANFSNTITVNDATGSPLNLTSYTTASQMRKSYQSSTAYNLNATITSASEGKVQISLTAAQSGSIPAGRYLYDVEVTASGGSKTRIVEGIAVVTPEITKI